MEACLLQWAAADRRRNSLPRPWKEGDRTRLNCRLQCCFCCHIDCTIAILAEAANNDDFKQQIVRPEKNNETG